MVKITELLTFLIDQATVVHILRTKAECVSESVYTASLDLVLIVLRILNR